MRHEDFEQQRVTLEHTGRTVWVTFCTCGKAFWAFSSGGVYRLWEQHEAAVGAARGGRILMREFWGYRARDFVLRGPRICYHRG